jgi:hypothetical protein
MTGGCLTKPNLQPKIKFDQLPKKAFNQTPNLTENFDQLKMSREIRSSDHSPRKSQHFQKVGLVNRD